MNIITALEQELTDLAFRKIKRRIRQLHDAANVLSACGIDYNMTAFDKSYADCMRFLEACDRSKFQVKIEFNS